MLDEPNEDLLAYNVAMATPQDALEPQSEGKQSEFVLAHELSEAARDTIGTPEADTPRLTVEIGSASREHHHPNEDFVVAASDLGLAVILDGVSGEANGDQASRIGGEAFVAYYRNLAEPEESLEAAVENFIGAFQAAHDATIRAELGGAQAAVVATKIYQPPDGGQPYALVASYGDCRAYNVYRSRDGETIELEQITTDNIDANTDESLVRAKYREQTELARYVPGEQYDRPKYLDTRDGVEYTIGGSLPRIVPAVQTLRADPGDIFLLTGDGEHDNLHAQEMAETISAVTSQGGSAAGMAEALVAQAEARSKDTTHPWAKGDDITVQYMIIK
jgi:serine/threonine protein phosphatase PrpC